MLSTLREESEIRERGSAEVERAFSMRHPNLARLKLPYVEVREPREVVEHLARQLSVSQLLPV